ncbi:SDR family NAD(P)-dependent oxidoreductase [Citricoccus alkalitolerans]|uniref:SDR family NAD(P)-dependent oxidoreductase n=1 Tax=Citricoccus alkalitolerans TaxID=246603 RepID=A0ABV8XUH8_9MICC
MLLEHLNGLITGAAGGIGRAAALACSREGATVVIADLPTQRERLEETAEAIRAIGGSAHIEYIDVTSLDDQRRAASAVVTEFGSLDFTFNNAGVEQETPFLDITEAAFDWVMNINTKGVFLGMKAQLEIMIPQGSGAIVNMASAAGIRGLAGYAGYASSKHAVVGLTKSVAVEYGDTGVRINAVAPAAIDSPMLQELSEEARDDLVVLQAIKRLGDPDEAAQAAVWLASPRASFVTGTVLSVDAGSSAF